jgi:subtilase family serine protease
MTRFFKNKIGLAILLTALVCLLATPELGTLSTVKAAPVNWSAQTLFEARPLAQAGPDPLTPTQILSAYNLASTNGGAGKTIAIVDAYNDPTISNDLSTFSTNFGLPTATLTVHKMLSYISNNANWAVEISLDVEWAHAIAPSASILLVEATSSSLSSLLSAVQYAASQSGVVAVSMSWGGSEFSTESSYDNYFTTPSTATAPISFFASAGDTAAQLLWPATSPNIVSVGGTTLTMSGNTVVSETAWSDSGGGVSAYEAMPTYQTNFGLNTQLQTTYRAVPDVAYDADPNTGVYVYDSTPYNGQAGWWDVGGTSAGAPQWAAIQALGATANDPNLYATAASSAYSTEIYDVISGSNGHSAGPGYDLVTGIGSPRTSTFQPVTTPDFSLSAPSVTIPAGTTGTNSVTVTSIDGYSSPVTLTLSDSLGFATLPTPTIITPTGTATMSITVPAGTADTTDTVTVTGTAGSTVHTTTFTLTVTNPDFSVSASPNSVNVPIGGQGATSTVTVTAKDGFTGSVSLTDSNLPSGVTATFNPSTVTIASGATSATSTLTLSAATGASSGTITVTGTSSSASHTTTVGVTVTTADFGLTANPTSLSIRPGSLGTSRITVSSIGGYTGSPTLSASGMPNGMTATFNTNPVKAGSSSTLMFMTSGTTAAGTYTITITGTDSTHALKHTTTISVTVT